ncbi:hypothetical protein SAMN05192575_11323 [Nocardioides alpinus]|uniref:Uncharacterized protein n=1 Tax=Nocardioides alpinus TaxID=748909 RepID=A0A1I1B4T8_9ACTN|nr:hypothetical protein SAMN05192575_11323 [Nocardioides alpinus]
MVPRLTGIPTVSAEPSAVLCPFRQRRIRLPFVRVQSNESTRTLSPPELD